MIFRQWTLDEIQARGSQISAGHELGKVHAITGKRKSVAKGRKADWPGDLAQLDTRSKSDGKETDMAKPSSTAVAPRSFGAGRASGPRMLLAGAISALWQFRIRRWRKRMSMAARALALATSASARAQGFRPEVLDKAARHIEKFLEPASDSALANALMPLAMSLKFESKLISEENEEKFYLKMVAELMRHLRGTPIDYRSRSLRCSTSERVRFFRRFTEMVKHVTPLLEKRRNDLWRTKRIIECQNAPAKAKAFQPEPRDIQLRATIARWRKHGDHFMAGRLRESAIRAELELADLEKRALEDWAQEQSTEPAAVAASSEAVDDRWHLTHVAAPDLDAA